MSEQSYPGAPNADAVDQVEHVDDVELLDPAAPVADDETAVVIEGEAVDLDDADNDESPEADGGPAAWSERDARPAHDEQAEQDADDAAEAAAEAQDAGPNGTGVLVLDTWQIQIPATGDATVDAALARLTDVEGLPPSQHADVYEAVHAGLHEALADLDRA